MAGEKIKIEEEAISEILIADNKLRIKKNFQLESHNNEH